MKTIIATLLVSAAFLGGANAADMTMQDPTPAPAAAPAVYDWSGLYLGVFGGAATGDNDFSATDGVDSIDLGLNSSGLFGGAQVGYDFQAGNIVIGAVADIAFSDISADISLGAGGLGTISAESELKYLGTARGRLGYALDRFLVYGHGGLAYGKTEQSISLSGAGSLETDNDVKLGYTVGAGVEVAITDRVSFQTEYAYTDLGKDDIYSDGGITIDEDLDFHSLKAAINFRF